MQQIPDIPRHLKLRAIQNQPLELNDRTPTAIFQFVIQEDFLLKVNNVCRIKFTAFYKYENIFYEHPFILHTNFNEKPIFQFTEQGLYNIPLFLKLKRLRDFNDIDLKNYYRTIDENLENESNSSDFHDVYLKISYSYYNPDQWTEYLCNDGLPLHLPTFRAKSWSKTDTVFRFRYDAEQREGEFPCQMSLLLNDTIDLNSYKIVLCLTTNTIPARMDFHCIRWICKLKPKATKRRRVSTTVDSGEQLYYLNHSSGIILANVSGSDLTFIPNISSGQIKSCYEPKNFSERLTNSEVKDTYGLTIGVIKQNEYPKIVRMRRTDEDIRRYIPFDELNDQDNNLVDGNAGISNRLKRYRKQCYKPLILYDNNLEAKFYSQAHVRPYAAAFDKNDVLYAETLHPPLRDAKKFEQIELCRIVQSTFELHSGGTEFIYCTYDTEKLKSELPLSPYILEFAFSSEHDRPNTNQLLNMFKTQHINTQTFHVHKCPNLLQFQVPNVPTYHKHRVFIRLQHKSSLDYNPSAPALTDNNQRWIYYADKFNDTYVATMIDEIEHVQKNDGNNGYLNTPCFALEAFPQFSFPDPSILNDI